VVRAQIYVLFRKLKIDDGWSQTCISMQPLVVRHTMLSRHMLYIKQLLGVEHDIMNYQNRGLCNLPKSKAEADNTDTRF